MEMRPLKMLSGAEIVDRGRNVSNCILPEVGSKEVTPNSSWLESKQIEIALEKRKSLVAVERIDKVGALSHAEWRDQLKLAEVTQQVGGHWQYIGHNVNGTFFLLPEEALYLIETNCLLLKHNQVTVSLQKAYSLLLDDNTALTQYKVYASLSRVGYKVFKHDKFKLMTDVNIKSAESHLLKKKIVKMDTTFFKSIDLSPENGNTANCDSTSSENPPNDSTKLDTKLTGISEPAVSPAIDIKTNGSKTLSTMVIDVLFPPNNPTNQSINTQKDVPLPLDTDMAIDLPLPPNDTLNESGTSDVLMPSHTVVQNCSQSDLPLPLDTDMSIDLPLPPITSNNTCETSNSVPVDCNMESTVTVDTLLPKKKVPGELSIDKLGNISNTDDTISAKPNNDIITNGPKTLLDMAIDLPLPPNDTSKKTESPDKLLPSDIAVKNNSQIAIFVSPLDTDMTTDLPLEPITLDNDSKTSDSVPIDCNTSIESTIDILLPKKVEKTKDSIPGVLSIDEHGVIRSATEEPADIDMTTVFSSKQNDIEEKNESIVLNKPGYINIYQILKHNINQKKLKVSNTKLTPDKFKDVPDCHKQQVVTVHAPSEDLLPRRVFLNHTSYVLNINNIRSCKRPKTAVPNRCQQRKIPNTSEQSSENAAVPILEVPQYLPDNAPSYQQPFGYFPQWRPPFPRQNFHQHPYFYRIMHFMPPNFNYNRLPPQSQPQWQHRPQTRPRQQLRQKFKNPRQPRNPQNQSQKQRQTVKAEHLQAIKNLARKLKMLPRKPRDSVKSLMGLMARFNEIYNERMRIRHDLTVVNDVEENVETIELDDDEVQIVKSPPTTNSANFDKYLEEVKKLAARLKNLGRKNQSVLRQKRAFQYLLKNFNETFNADLYLDSKGELKDNKLVVLDSSSDSDVVASEDVELEQTNKKRRSSGENNDSTQNKKRKLFNPFHILKKVNAGASTSNFVLDDNSFPHIPIENNSTELLKYFDRNWLPADDDFGKAIVCFNTQYLLTNSQQLYDLVEESDAFENWIDLKLSFCEHMEAVSTFEQHLTEHSIDLTRDRSTLKSILVQDPNDDCPASMEKLRIIKTAVDVQETKLIISFDVYNRDVQNFRKTDPPKPHFRVVCVDECSEFPSGAEVRTVHQRCDDDVNIVFAVVGIDSITYLQMNPKDLPVIIKNY